MPPLSWLDMVAQFWSLITCLQGYCTLFVVLGSTWLYIIMHLYFDQQYQDSPECWRGRSKLSVSSQRVENVEMRLNKPLQTLDPRLKHYRTLPAQKTEFKVVTPKPSQRLGQGLRLPEEAHRYVLWVGVYPWSWLKYLWKDGNNTERNVHSLGRFLWFTQLSGRLIHYLWRSGRVLLLLLSFTEIIHYIEYLQQTRRPWYLTGLVWDGTLPLSVRHCNVMLLSL